MICHYQNFTYSIGIETHIRRWASAMLASYPGQRPVREFILMLDELCSNVVKHGLPDAQEHYRGQPVTVEVSLMLGLCNLEAQVSYRGGYFDLCAYKPQPIDELKSHQIKGGLGIRIIRQLADSINYEFRPERSLNVYTIRKALLTHKPVSFLTDKFV